MKGANHMKMTMIKTNEADGIVLDWLLAKTRGVEIVNPNQLGEAIRLKQDGRCADALYSPITNWLQGGNVVEDLIEAGFHFQKGEFQPCKCIRVKGDEVIVGFGPTILVAAGRAWVTMQLGDEAEVPKKLLSDEPLARSRSARP